MIDSGWMMQLDHDYDNDYDYDFGFGFAREREGGAWFRAGGVVVFRGVGGDGRECPARSGGGEVEAMRGAMEELQGVEASIRELQEGRLLRERMLLEARESLQSSEAALSETGSLEDEGLRTLDEAMEQALELERRLSEERREQQGVVRQSERQAREAAAWLWLGEQTADEVTPLTHLDLSLLQQHHRNRAAAAGARILRMEAEIELVDRQYDHAAAGARRYTVFSEYRLEQLREQHQEITDRLAELQSEMDRRSEELETLSGRREELNGLLAELVEEEVARGEESDVAQAEATPAAVVPAVEDEAIEPLPSATGERDEAGLERSGPRQLRWHATPIGVRAPAGGRVVYSGAFAGYRHLLIVDMGDGWHGLFGNPVAGGCGAGVGGGGGGSAGDVSGAGGGADRSVLVRDAEGVDAGGAGGLPAAAGGLGAGVV